MATDLIPFKVGEASPANTFFAIWMAQAAGLYAENGLDFHIVKMVGGSETGPALREGRIQLMHIGMSSVVASWKPQSEGERMSTDADCDTAREREWLIATGDGGYALGTVSGIATRRYHGQLVAALPPPIGLALPCKTLMLVTPPASAR